VVGQSLVRVTGVPHARAYAALLPHTLRAMVPRAPRQLAALAGALGTEPRAEAAPPRVGELAARAGARRLTDIGMDPGAVDEVVEAILARGDLGGGPGPPPDEAEIRAIVEAAL
jgi:alcohol dehydrogenase class IV